MMADVDADLTFAASNCLHAGKFTASPLSFCMHTHLTVVASRVATQEGQAHSDKDCAPWY